jgi:glycosyltransferase involved in cell wall biosynthesis
MKGRPRIGIDVTSAVTQGGGIGRYTRELVNALARKSSDYDYHLFSAKQPRELPVPDPVPSGDNITLHRAPLGERWLYRLWYRLNVPLQIQWFTGRLDLFHSPDFVLPPVQGNIPTLLTVHDLSFVHFPDTFTPSLVSYLNKTVAASVRRATHILADSKATKDDLVSIWNTRAEKVTVLYSGVNRKFRPESDARKSKLMRKKYGLGEEPYLLSVSTLQPRKNYQMLIRAFRQVADSYPHHLVIAGNKGWLYEQIVEEVRAQELTERVSFIGFVDDNDLPTLYSAATLFVFPSLYEGFGLPLLEAMACGVPVLTSNSSCLPEVAGEAAIQLSPEIQEDWTRAMSETLGNPTRRTNMVAAGFLQAREFTWSEAAAQLLDVYQNLLL